VWRSAQAWPGTARPSRWLSAFQKKADLRFLIGYSPLAYRDTVHLIAEGKINGAPMITGIVG
jgi:hypothetical protein